MSLTVKSKVEVPRLIEKRRRQIIAAAIELFARNGSAPFILPRSRETRVAVPCFAAGHVRAPATKALTRSRVSASVCRLRVISSSSP